MGFVIFLILVIITLPYIATTIGYILGFGFIIIYIACIIILWCLKKIVKLIKKLNDNSSAIQQHKQTHDESEPQNAPASPVSLAKPPTPKPLPIKPFTPKEKFELYVGCVCIGYAVFASVIAIYTTADFVDAVAIWLVLTALTSLLVQKKYKKFDED